MEPDIQRIQLQAQTILDQLFTEHSLPFELSAHLVDRIGINEYIIRFHDSRLHSIDISLASNQCFKDVFRKSILDRVTRLHAPVHKFGTPLAA